MTRIEMERREAQQVARIERLKAQVASLPYVDSEKEQQIEDAKELLRRFRIFMETGSYPMVEVTEQ